MFNLFFRTIFLKKLGEVLNFANLKTYHVDDKKRSGNGVRVQRKVGWVVSYSRSVQNILFWNETFVPMLYLYFVIYYAPLKRTGIVFLFYCCCTVCGTGHVWAAVILLLKLLQKFTFCHTKKQIKECQVKMGLFIPKVPLMYAKNKRIDSKNLRSGRNSAGRKTTNCLRFKKQVH